jgi:hypothetical protein
MSFSVRPRTKQGVHVLGAKNYQVVYNFLDCRRESGWGSSKVMRLLVLEQRGVLIFP